MQPCPVDLFSSTSDDHTYIHTYMHTDIHRWSIAWRVTFGEGSAGTVRITRKPMQCQGRGGKGGKRDRRMGGAGEGERPRGGKRKMMARRVSSREDKRRQEKRWMKPSLYVVLYK